MSISGTERWRHSAPSISSPFSTKTWNGSYDDAQLGVAGNELLKALTPISDDISSDGTVEFNGQLFSKSDLTEETLEWLEWYNSLSPEEQLSVSSIPADLYTNDDARTVDSNAEE